MDDAAVMRKAFSRILDYFGYTSVCTSEGTEALKLYKQARCDGNPFTGVILDLHNRLGKGGLETMVDLRELDPQVYVVLCSADIDAPAMTHFQAYGFRDALAKPFGLDELDNILQSML